MLTKLLKNKVILALITSFLIFGTVLFFSQKFYILRESFELINTKIHSFVIEKNSYNNKKSNKIVVVEIDNATTNEFGFPFSRKYYAQTIQNLNKAGATVVGLDVILADKSPDLAGDDILAATLKQEKNVVLGGAIIREEKNGTANISVEKPRDIFFNEILNFGYYKINVHPISNEAVSFTPSYLLTDTKKTNTKKLEKHFTIALLQAYFSKITGNNLIDFHKTDQQNFYITPTLAIPFAEENSKQVLLNYIPTPKQGKLSQFANYSFLDVYNNNINPEVFKGKIVLIGYTAKGIKDIFHTPNGQEYGVYVLANIVNMILEEQYLHYFYDSIELIILFILITLAVYLNLARSGYVLIFSNLAIATLFLVLYPITTFSFNYLPHYIFEIFFALVLSLIVSNIIKYLIENKSKAKLNEALSQYVSKDVAQEILSESGEIKLNGEQRKLAIFFSDIEGFTSISEQFSAEKLLEFLREYLTEMSNILMDEKGFINKYEGDALMGLWGCFNEYNNSAHFACKGALEQQKRLKELNAIWSEQGLPEIKARIGLHAGNAIVGNIGSIGKKLEYTAIGDNVNLASRLEGVNKFYGTYICVSESIYQETKEAFEYRKLDEIRVKGKQEAIGIYELLGEKGDKGNVAKEKFEKAFSLYQQQHFQEAKDIFLELQAAGDAPSNTYIERCQYLLSHAPEKNWDGVWTFTSK